MKLFKKLKDGGQESSVTGYFLIEYKPLFSVVLLNFRGKSRSAYHTHAFDAVSWLLKGKLDEQFYDGADNTYLPSLKPIYTPRECFHKVDSIGSSWVLSLRGRWKGQWEEYLEDEKRHRLLTNGRIEVVDNSL